MNIVMLNKIDFGFLAKVSATNLAKELNIDIEEVINVYKALATNTFVLLEDKVTYKTAIDFAKLGFLIRHRNFMVGEHFEHNGIEVVDEQGNSMTGWYRSKPWQDGGWEISIDSLDRFL